MTEFLAIHMTRARLGARRRSMEVASSAATLALAWVQAGEQAAVLKEEYTPVLCRRMDQTLQASANDGLALIQRLTGSPTK